MRETQPDGAARLTQEVIGLLQIHVRDGRVRLYTISGADWSKRYPLIVRDAGRIEGTAIMD